jgi:hypothetical protein
MGAARCAPSLSLTVEAGANYDLAHNLLFNLAVFLLGGYFKGCNVRP